MALRPLPFLFPDVLHLDHVHLLAERLVVGVVEHVDDETLQLVGAILEVLGDLLQVGRRIRGAVRHLIQQLAVHPAAVAADRARHRARAGQEVVQPELQSLADELGDSPVLDLLLVLLIDPVPIPVREIPQGTPGALLDGGERILRVFAQGHLGVPQTVEELAIVRSRADDLLSLEFANAATFFFVLRQDITRRQCQGGDQYGESRVSAHDSALLHFVEIQRAVLALDTAGRHARAVVEPPVDLVLVVVAVRGQHEVDRA